VGDGQVLENLSLAVDAKHALTLLGRLLFLARDSNEVEGRVNPDIGEHSGQLIREHIVCQSMISSVVKRAHHIDIAIVVSATARLRKTVMPLPTLVLHGGSPITVSRNFRLYYTTLQEGVLSNVHSFNTFLGYLIILCV
jgi:hypothetical protein